MWISSYHFLKFSGVIELGSVILEFTHRRPFGAIVTCVLGSCGLFFEALQNSGDFRQVKFVIIYGAEVPRNTGSLDRQYITASTCVPQVLHGSARVVSEGNTWTITRAEAGGHKYPVLGRCCHRLEPLNRERHAVYQRNPLISRKLRVCYETSEMDIPSSMECGIWL
jgi:hypothetical protein